MLVLTRKAGEEIQIGEDIRLVVRRIAGNRVVLAIEAPQGMRILRGELVPFADPFGVGSDGGELDDALAHPQRSACGICPTGQMGSEVSVPALRQGV
jgi:carbon storage regulator